MGVAPGVLTEFWGYQQQDFCGDLQKFSQKILDTEDAPNVFSISYGWQGKLSQLGCQDSEVQKVDVNFQKLAARGVSMIIASGDTGAWTPGFSKRSIIPIMASTSPWVTVKQQLVSSTKIHPKLNKHPINLVPVVVSQKTLTVQMLFGKKPM